MSSHPALPRPASPSPLKLFDGQAGPSIAEIDDPTGIHSGNTLREFFDRWCWPRWRLHAAPRGDEVFLDALKHWEAAVANPRLREIDEETSLALETYFLTVACKRSGKTLSPNTAIKNIKSLQKILDAAGPTIDRKKKTARLLDETPWLDRPEKLDKKPVDDFTLDEINRMIAAATHATRPEFSRYSYCPANYATPLFWRCLLPLLYCTGLRIGVTMLLRWEWVKEDVIEIPGVVSDHIWSKKGRKPEEAPLNQTAQAALQQLRRVEHGERVFFVPFSSRKTLYGAFDALQEIANLDPARRFGFHGFRKAHYNAVCQFDPLIASPALGHSSHSTGVNSYKNPDRIREAKEAIAQPTIDSDDRQQMLF